jgi:hypothetical protein
MTTPNSSNGPEGTIPVGTAIELTANWRTYLATSNQAFVAQSFFIPIIDFKNILLHNPDAEGVRAYIGLSDAADPTTAQLLLVPVSHGHDVVYLPNYGNGGEDGSNVFDQTTPCPPICPLPSVLNQ